MIRGSCLCGEITWSTEASLNEACVCHCTQCRKQSGHVWASAQVATDRLTIEGQPSWFRASEVAARGFCPTCGSFLFWRGDGEDETSVALGSINAPSGLALEKHIFAADKGDYYVITDDLPVEP